MAGEASGNMIEQIMSIHVDPYTPAPNKYDLSFFNLTNFTNTFIELSLNFTHPNLISSSALRPDTLIIKILCPEFFVDINDYQRV